MFKKTDKESEQLDDTQTLIGPSIEVKGDFEGAGDVIVEGKLSGTLKTKKDLRVGPDAVIEADIEAKNVLVAGEIKGSVKAHEGTELAGSSKVTGDIETGSLLIEKGAIFNGNCLMTMAEEEAGEQEDKKMEKKETKEKKGEQQRLDDVEEIYKDEEN
ncbi:polymer-forming cytoskeletal protein [Candidatus Falkowbacteria bacterium]|nr:polymer-forming cytoskeletal protein [Candidatus Falkowbacteria bacterium]